MAWRVIDCNDEVWHVQPAAEKRANHSLWQLMFSFRQVAGADNTAFWTSYPIESSSKSSIFTQAETLSDEKLRELLTEHFG